MSMKNEAEENTLMAGIFEAQKFQYCRNNLLDMLFW